MRGSCLVPFVATLLTTPLAAQLAGTYTINPTWPASTANFVSLASATTALAAQGVAGPVTLLIYDDAGPYTESSTFVTANPFAPQNAVLVFTQWAGVSATNRVTFQPAPGEQPVFDATAHAMGVFWGGADYVTLQGIEIKNAIFDAISLYSETSHGQAIDPIIDGCRLHDCGGTGVCIYGNTPNPLNTVVQNCTLWRLQLTNAGSFSTTGRFGYVTTRRSQGTRLVHNTFFMDTGTGSLLCAIGAYPSSASEVPYAEVSNNIVVKNVAATAPIFRINSPVGTSFPVPIVCESNCFHDTSGGPFALLGLNPTTTVATLLDWQTTQLRDLASIQGDPLFRGSIISDFHLLAGSPCQNASTVAGNVPFDADGQARNVPDLGADEATAASVVPFGIGCLGSTGQRPLLATNEAFLGNSAFTLTIAQVPPGTLTVLFGSLGLGPTPIPFGGGCLIYLDLPSLTGLTPAVTGPVGTASVTFDLPANPAFVGVVLAYQSLALDGAAAIGLTMSNAVTVQFAF